MGFCGILSGVDAVIKILSLTTQTLQPYPVLITYYQLETAIHQRKYVKFDFCLKTLIKSFIEPIY